ncbi:uncharacterized protein LOC134700212 [Mytilus trossulus]|uniref:uncharacterized protein LOC134700212 n=1 Tax=Mytilus trossulus TaxID=6551 RepID=UPI003007A3FE
MLLIVLTFLLLTGESYGTECIHCTDMVLNSSSIPSEVKVELEQYRTPYCENAHTAKNSSGITLRNCSEAVDVGQASKCGRLVGSILLSSGQSENKLELPIYFHIRGCFVVEQSLGGGCYRNHRFIDQYKDTMSKYLEGTAGSVQLGNFNGVLCINGANTVDPWKTNQAIRHNHCWVTCIVLFMVYCLL